ncbi:MAG TPA: nuclear transport factor 2 family protein [Actinomycetota bacterium]|jgi:hypothetical protein|nr:nuclear transport factor 2 family protein [Actinomycetota bacterium]
MDTETWLEAYRVAWETADTDAAAPLFTEDATYRSNIFEEPYTGHDGVRTYWSTVTETQSDVRVRIGRPFGEGERVAAEFWTNMRVAGEEVTLPGCLLLAFTPDGRCRALREYWHYVPGTFDPPPEWGD